MNIVIVFPTHPDGVPKHFTCGEDDIWIRSEISGLKALIIDVLILLPGCSEEQRSIAIDKTKAANNPIILST